MIPQPTKRVTRRVGGLSSLNLTFRMFGGDLIKLIKLKKIAQSLIITGIVCLNASLACGEQSILAYGMSYSDFVSYTRSHDYGEPIAITSKNRMMYYTLPYQPEIYFQFAAGRLERVTHRTETQGFMYDAEIPLSEAFNCRWRYAFCLGGLI